MVKYDEVHCCDKCRHIRAFATEEDFKRWSEEEDVSMEDMLCCALAEGTPYEKVHIDVKIYKTKVMPWCPLPNLPEVTVSVGKRQPVGDWQDECL